MLVFYLLSFKLLINTLNFKDTENIFDYYNFFLK
jgi:hypothetical protein